MPDNKRNPQESPTLESSPEEAPAQNQGTQENEGLSDFWNDILGPRLETIEQRLIRELGIPHPGTFTLATSSGKKIVSIDPNGKVTYGEGIKPDEAAELFWTNMALKRVGMEQRLQHLAITEAMLIRMGRADVNYERAQLAADAQGASDHDRAIAERARMNLESIVHQVMDFARGLARQPVVPPSPETAPQAPQRPRGDPDCPTCRGEGQVFGDCGDSPNVWYDPCPTCRPDPNCATCHGTGMVDDLGDPMAVWRAPCPACRPVDPNRPIP